MGVRGAFPVVAVTLMAASVSAGDHKFGAFAAPSYLSAHGSSLGLVGFHLSGEATIPWGKIVTKDQVADYEHKQLSLAGDLSVHFEGDEDTVSERTDPTQISFAIGPRLELFAKHRLAPFVQAMLAGVVYRSGAGNAESNAATGSFTFGGGLTFDLGEHHGWAIRAQVDYVLPLSNDLGQAWRYSVGALYRFPYHK